MASSTIKNNELKSSTDYGKLSTRYSTSMRWPCARWARSEEHTSELQSQSNLVCRLLLEKKKNHVNINQVLVHDTLVPAVTESATPPTLQARTLALGPSLQFTSDPQLHRHLSITHRLE